MSSATLLVAVLAIVGGFGITMIASRRAVAMLRSGGMVSPMEEKGVQEVLRAAALTYVAALFTAVMQLLYYASLVMGGRRR